MQEQRGMNIVQPSSGHSAYSTRSDLYRRRGNTLSQAQAAHTTYGATSAFATGTSPQDTEMIDSVDAMLSEHQVSAHVRPQQYAAAGDHGDPSGSGAVDHLFTRAHSDLDLQPHHHHPHHPHRHHRHHHHHPGQQTSLGLKRAHTMDGRMHSHADKGASLSDSAGVAHGMPPTGVYMAHDTLQSPTNPMTPLPAGLATGNLASLGYHVPAADAMGTAGVDRMAVASVQQLGASAGVTSPQMLAAHALGGVLRAQLNQTANGANAMSSQSAAAAAAALSILQHQQQQQQQQMAAAQFQMLVQQPVMASAMLPQTQTLQSDVYVDSSALVANLQQQRALGNLPPGAAAAVAAAVASGNLHAAARLSLPAMMLPPPSPNIYPFFTVADDKWRRDANWAGVASPRQQYYDPVRPHAGLPHPTRRSVAADYANLMREYGRPAEEIIAAAAAAAAASGQPEQLSHVQVGTLSQQQHVAQLPAPRLDILAHPQHQHHPLAQQQVHTAHYRAQQQQAGIPLPHTRPHIAVRHQAPQQHLSSASNGHWQPSALGTSRHMHLLQKQPLQPPGQLMVIPPSASLMSAPIPGLPDFSYQDVKNEAWRDRLLAQAHTMYAAKPRDESTLQLLHLIHTYHPDHLPTMLLMACVYFAHQKYQLSLHYNVEILKRDSQYVEAMSNIGTTLRGMGRNQDAEAWWWRAIQLRPNYWDAVDNLVGVLCSVGPDGKADPARYREALKVCDFVAASVIGRDGRAVVRAGQIPRLQNVLHVAANLHYQLGDLEAARREYERVLRVMFGGLTTDAVVAQVMCTFGHQPGALLLLVPEQAINIVAAVFPGGDGMLPGMVSTGLPSSPTTVVAGGSAISGQELTPQQIQQSNQVTATVLLTLAKWHQDAASCPPAALSMVLPLYYLSLSLHRSPSTCNNLGILLSGLQQTVADPATGAALGGAQLAMRYYTFGLKLDPRHAHLYTNLGSLLKDAGQLEQAIQMYERAVQFNPKFDVALANLANAVKDAGRVQDSIQWYRSAVEVNPDFAEAVCGLVNALGGVCDWRGRGGVAAGWTTERGWMEKVIEIVDKQLGESRGWAAGLLASDDGRRFLDDLREVWAGTGVDGSTSGLPRWLVDTHSLPSVSAASNGGLGSEGGWILRTLEKCLRRVQRHWYLNEYGDPERGIQPRIPNGTRVDVAHTYRRPRLPLIASPPVPTVLPFHTFTYPLSSVQVRLISHRNALRISHNALTANWLPTTVYPPPPPPSPRLRIGYVSSDFNNHPLAHLMQSVFGFHDRQRCTVICYAITPPDGSPYRAKIERESDVFLDVSAWTTQAIVERI
ncbi:hypothetical protein THASP1DRAFT_31443, partial [Thamnocephalis sphaerospora]